MIDVAVEKVWAAIRDYGAVIKSVPDPLVKWTERHASLRSKMAGSPGELLGQAIDDHRRRLAYSETGGRFITRSASVQVLSDGEKASRVVWINDVLPNEYAELIDGNIDRGPVLDEADA